MRVKKRSKNRKAVKFYSTCFGFREPYKVLIDGTFVHHLITQRLLPADEALRDLLSASRTPALFTSKCIVAELRRLGKSHAESFDSAQLLATTKCEHDKVVSAVNCVLSLIGDKNPEHFFVATQDADLREKLREIPGVPVIYGLKNSLFIEQPSVQQRKFAQLDEEKRLNMDISEYKKLMKAASEGKTTASENGSDGEQHERPISSLVKNALGVADKSKFKRNRAKVLFTVIAFLVSFVGWLTISSVYYLSRHQQWLSSLLLIYFLYQMLTSILFQGPNPLSCKKKKPKPQPSAIQNQGATVDGEAKRKRVRKRKRSQKDNKQAETTS